jgi:hypothetical protein
MEENSPAKKIIFSEPDGSRKKGRPTLSWLHIVLKDVKLLKVEAWRKHLIGITEGESSWRPKSIKDCRVRGRKKHNF